MTTKERIEKAKKWNEAQLNKLIRESYLFSKSELHELLEQVAKEQRTICAESGFDTETGEYTFHCIETAPSPLRHE